MSRHGEWDAAASVRAIVKLLQLKECVLDRGKLGDVIVEKISTLQEIHKRLGQQMRVFSTLRSEISLNAFLLHSTFTLVP